MARSAAKRSLMSGLHHVLEMDDAEQPLAVGHGERRAAGARDPVDRLAELRRRACAVDADELQHRVHRALAHLAATDIDAGEAGLGGERDDRSGLASGCSSAEFAGGERHDRTALGRLVGEAGEQRGLGQFGLASRRATGRNSVAMRLPKVMVPVLSSSSVSTSPAASTARPEVAMTLKRTSRSMPAMPMADSSPPMVVGISVTSSAASTVTVSTVPE